MRKKNKLYTVNHWNRPAFMTEENIFDVGGQRRRPANSQPDQMPAQAPQDTPNAPVQPIGLTGFGGAAANQMMQNFAGSNKAVSNPWSFKEAFSKQGLKDAAGAAGAAAISAGAGIIGGLAGNAISGGLESGAGSAVSSLGSTVGSAVSSVNPILGGAITLGSGLVGGLVNRAFGTKVDQAKLNEINKNYNMLNSFTSTAGSFDDIQGPTGVSTDTSAYSGGWFSSSKARRKNAELREKLAQAKTFAQRSVDNNIFNVATEQTNDALANYSAFGGLIDRDDMSAINYGFMSDYLANKKKLAENKNQMTNMFMGSPSTMFAFGGDMQANGSDFPTGLMHIDAGGSHEMNPNDGVQLGVDNEGTPNLVEEGEVVWNDYVYSNRIKIDNETRQKFHIGKNRKLTYADLAKKLEKEIEERPNDPISRAGFEAQMQSLEDEQERQKQQMEAERAKLAFESLSPEEQVAVMQQAAAEEQAIANEQAQQEAIAQQQMMAQQQEQPMMQADGSQAALGQEAQPMMAEGGHLLKKGGYKWDSFWEPTNEYSKKAGNSKNKYAIDKTYKGNIKDLENSEAFKAFTNYILNEATDDERQKYFEWIDKNTGRSNKYLTDGKLVDNWKDMFQAARTDGLYGIQHYTPDWEEVAEEEAAKEAAAEPRVFHAMEDDEDYIQGELDPNVVGDEVRRSVLPNGDTVIYHARKAPAATTPETSETTETLETEPRHRAEWPRYAGLFGPAVGLGMMAAGIGKPDKGSIDAAISGAGDVALASYQPLGNYLTYRPMDIWYEQNRMNANARATDRAILNSGANQGAKMAGLLASGYNDQIASGDLYRKALEYNDALRERVATFNRGTDQWNSGQFGETSRFNASARNQANQHASQLRLQAAREKADMDAGWYNSLYGNVAGLFKGLGDLGRENAQWNMIADAGADGVFGNLGTSYTGRRAVKQKTKKCKGGKLNKRRGLTF